MSVADLELICVCSGLSVPVTCIEGLSVARPCRKTPKHALMQSYAGSRFVATALSIQAVIRAHWSISCCGHAEFISSHCVPT